MHKQLFLLLLSIVAFTSCETKNNKFVKPDTWLDYTNINSPMQFKMAYPPKWEIKEEGQDGLIFYCMSPALDILDKMNENVNFVYLPLPDNVNDLGGLVEYVDRKMGNNYPEFSLALSEPSQFNGIDAQLMRYDMVYNEMPITIEQYVFIYNNTGYVWTFAAEAPRFNQYKPVADSIKASFSLIE